MSLTHYIVWFYIYLESLRTFAFGNDLLPKERSTKYGYNCNYTAIREITDQMDILNINIMKEDIDVWDFIGNLLPRLSVPRMVKHGHIVHNNGTFGRKIARNHFFFMESEHLIETLETFGSRKGILLFAFKDKPDELHLHEIAKDFWLRYGFYRIFYFFGTKAIFYNPFGKYNGHYGVLQSIREIPIDQILTPSRLNKYPLRIYIFDSVYSSSFGNASQKVITKVQGADAKVARLLSEKMDYTSEFQWPDDEFFGARLKNGSFNGAIGRMIRYETDITLTGFFVKDYLTRDVEFSVSVYMDKLCCYVMKAKRIPQSLMPLFAVHVDIWLAFTFMGFISSFVWMAFRGFNYKMGCYSLLEPKKFPSLKFQFIRIAIDTWCCWVRVSLEYLPPFFSERVFMVSLCMVSVIFGALFESSLATVYIHPLYYEDINSLQQLSDANLNIYIKHAAMKDDLFYGTNSPLWDHLNTKAKLVGETEERLIEAMSRRGGFCAVTRASSLVLDDIRYLITKKIHLIPECPKHYHIAFVFPKESPYIQVGNLWLLRFMEAGLIDQWINEMKFKSKISIHRFPQYLTEPGEIWKSLTLNDLQLSFFALFMGAVLAMLAFGVEFLMHLSIKPKVIEL